MVTARYLEMALKKVNVYFNDEDELELYESIVALSKKEKRSINQQIKVLLAEAMMKKEKNDK
ncbi:hypothetical protein NIES4071_110150 (plasmid) [Calothrix sp. NIES-4071]|nr:hypothetical protein NIES4071_110150 [Calothrix sp. NIES-4071]